MANATQKQINEDIVGAATLLLLEKNGKTTSLEVKDFLRGLGFWALQEDVSHYMASFEEGTLLEIDMPEIGRKLITLPGGKQTYEYTFVKDSDSSFISVSNGNAATIAPVAAATTSSTIKIPNDYVLTKIRSGANFVTDRKKTLHKDFGSNAVVAFDENYDNYIVIKAGTSKAKQKELARKVFGVDKVYARKLKNSYGI